MLLLKSDVTQLPSKWTLFSCSLILIARSHLPASHLCTNSVFCYLIYHLREQSSMLNGDGSASIMSISLHSQLSLYSLYVLTTYKKPQNNLAKATSENPRRMETGTPSNTVCLGTPVHTRNRARDLKPLSRFCRAQLRDRQVDRLTCYPLNGVIRRNKPP